MMKPIEKILFVLVTLATGGVTAFALRINDEAAYLVILMAILVDASFLLRYKTTKKIWRKKAFVCAICGNPIMETELSIKLFGGKVRHFDKLECFMEYRKDKEPV